MITEGRHLTKHISVNSEDLENIQKIKQLIIVCDSHRFVIDHLTKQMERAINEARGRLSEVEASLKACDNIANMLSNQGPLSEEES